MNRRAIDVLLAASLAVVALAAPTADGSSSAEDVQHDLADKGLEAAKTFADKVEEGAGMLADQASAGVNKMADIARAAGNKMADMAHAVHDTFADEKSGKGRDVAGRMKRTLQLNHLNPKHGEAISRLRGKNQQTMELHNEDPHRDSHQSNNEQVHMQKDDEGLGGVHGHQDYSDQHDFYEQDGEESRDGMHGHLDTEASAHQDHADRSGYGVQGDIHAGVHDHQTMTAALPSNHHSRVAAAVVQKK